MIVTIQVIDTYRRINTAYVDMIQHNPYLCKDCFINLDSIESIIGCKFNDGYHPSVTFNIDDKDIIYSDNIF